MRLENIVQQLGGAVTVPADGAGSDPEVRDVRLDSRAVEAGDLFCALPGTRTDGMRFAVDAVTRGAVALLAPRPLPEPLDIPVWVHPEARRVAGHAAALVHGRPSADMRVIGITGTNGKTSTA